MAGSAESNNLYNPGYFLNRELSLIEFNERVLAEAEDKSHPLLERLKFAVIFSTNLDEFFMIRVAGLKGQIAAGTSELSYDGLTPGQQLAAIRKRLEILYKRQEDILNDDLLPNLESHGIVIHNFKNITADDRAIIEKHFYENILPVLTPITVGPTNPFPRIIDRSLNIAFTLIDERKKTPEKRVAFVQVPTVLPRFINLPRGTGYHFVLIEQVIKAFAEVLFPGMVIQSSYTFRLTRDADIEIAEDEAEDLMTEVEEQIKQRRWGRVAVRLEVGSKMPDHLVNLLMDTLDLEPGDVYVHDRPVNLSDFMTLTKLELPELKDKHFVSSVLNEFQAEGRLVFDAVKRKDFLVHHPYDSFGSSTLRFIDQAATDPDVIAIKITLYRTGLQSPVVAALKKAAENGKYVTAFVELKARFDEANNIIWAKELEHAGVHVVYGVPGLKTHCKICIVVRREGGVLKTYLHLSTGNYNIVTSRLYTDIGMFTSDEDFARDATFLFNYLTGYSYRKDWNKMVVAPINLYDKLMEKIERETELHTEENPGFIFAKMNSLAHKDLMPALYRASRKGVRVQLLVRGICCLKPGLPGVSENIEVRSILGRFLEHSRIFYFKNGGSEEFFLSSADWMSRNLHNRVELMFPVDDENLRRQLWDILNISWRDNTKAWRLNPDGSYTKISPAENEVPFSSQEFFMKQSSLSRGNAVFV